MNSVIRLLSADILILIVTAIIISSCASSENFSGYEFQIVELKEFYYGEGAIIPETSSQYFSGQMNTKRFTPTLEQVKKAENILKEDLTNHYNKLLKDGIFYFRSGEDTVEAFNEALKMMRDKIKRYYRYYIGFINEKDEQFIIIHLFNYSTRQSKSIYDNWKNEYIFGADGFFEDNTLTYNINLSKKQIY
jgi:hypothetical protein